VRYLVSASFYLTETLTHTFFRVLFWYCLIQILVQNLMFVNIGWFCFPSSCPMSSSLLFSTRNYLGYTGFGYFPLQLYVWPGICSTCTWLPGRQCVVHCCWQVDLELLIVTILMPCQLMCEASQWIINSMLDGFVWCRELKCQRGCMQRDVTIFLF
jgi:hypothetical protein